MKINQNYCNDRAREIENGVNLHRMSTPFNELFFFAKRNTNVQCQAMLQNIMLFTCPNSKRQSYNELQKWINVKWKTSLGKLFSWAQMTNFSFLYFFSSFSIVLYRTKSAMSALKTKNIFLSVLKNKNWNLIKNKIIFYSKTTK